MKIIGKTTSGIIADLTNDELARILGYYSDYAAKEKLGTDWNGINKEYKTDERYEQLQSLASIPKHIKTLSNALREAQAAVDKSVAIIEKSDITKIKESK